MIARGVIEDPILDRFPPTPNVTVRWSRNCENIEDKFLVAGCAGSAVARKRRAPEEWREIIGEWIARSHLSPVFFAVERLHRRFSDSGLAGALRIRSHLQGKRVVVVSGGNIDINLLDRIIGRGLTKMGRLARFSVDMADRPGELARLLAAVSREGANVRRIGHDRTRLDVPIGGARVMLELETRGPTHIDELRRKLEAEGYRLTLDGRG